MTETLAIRNADCLLTVTATQQAPGQLDLRYQVHNHGQLTLYLCNQLYELMASSSNAIPQLAPNLVHIQVEPAGVHLDKALMDLSFREGVRVLDIPYLTQLLPGHSYEQALHLALPLRPYRVHGNRPSQSPPAPLPLLFSLGYFKGEQGITTYAAIDGLPTDTYQVSPSRSKEQQLLTVGPFKEVVPVADTLLSTTPAQAASAGQWTPWG
jgi:hypothetical protein